MNPLLVGGALGALAMYFMDPQAGRRRRARTRDKAVHVAKRLNEAGKVTARDTAHRARGVIAGARRLLQREDVSDGTLVGRVRAALGRVVSHPHAIDVSASDGHVVLAGPILAHEVRPLIRTVRHVPGVHGLDDRLTVYQEASHVSALQGGAPRQGSRFELLQENWSPAARLATGALGAGLLIAATHARGGLCAVFGASGAALLARAATNLDLATLAGFGDAHHGIVVQKTINVDAPVAQVFGFWIDFQNFPRFMHNVKAVEVYEDRSHWTVAGPAGVPVHWTSELTNIIDNKLIEWRATRDSPVKHEGCVQFEAIGGNLSGHTRVTVKLRYVPPAGAFGHAVATLFGADPKSEMDADLMRMKSMIETGRAPHDAARPAVSRES
jgi:uncharacterized membrane protein